MGKVTAELAQKEMIQNRQRQSIIEDLEAVRAEQQAIMRNTDGWGAEPRYPVEARPFTLRGDILRTADKLTHGDRNAAYGDPVDNYRHTAAIANAIVGPLTGPITAQQMALLMVAVKLARLAKNTEHKDSYIDAAAYLGIAYECAVARADVLSDD